MYSVDVELITLLEIGDLQQQLIAQDRKSYLRACLQSKNKTERRLTVKTSLGDVWAGSIPVLSTSISSSVVEQHYWMSSEKK